MLSKPSQILKSWMCSAPPDVNESASIIVLDTDAINEGIGGGFSLIKRDGKVKPISYSRRSLSYDKSSKLPLSYHTDSGTISASFRVG